MIAELNSYTDPTSLRAHMIEQDLPEVLRRMIHFFADQCKYLSHAIRRSEGSMEGTFNPSGDQQTKLDVLVDTFLLRKVMKDKSIPLREYASEERKDIEQLDILGMYSAAADPLDGSKVVDFNDAVGTIIAIHHDPLMCGKPGRETLAAAMYVLYGPKTTLIYTAGKGAYEFEQDGPGNYYSRNDSCAPLELAEEKHLIMPGGNRATWTEQHRKYIESLETAEYKHRYHGTFVTDVNELLQYGGGIFSHPRHTNKGDTLRLMFELQAMAFIVEQAGGLATDGETPILDIIPSELHERRPIYIGSKNEVNLASRFVAGHPEQMSFEF